MGIPNVINVTVVVKPIHVPKPAQTCLAHIREVAFVSGRVSRLRASLQTPSAGLNSFRQFLMDKFLPVIKSMDLPMFMKLALRNVSHAAMTLC